MKEFDFDELDRAVSSLMDKAGVEKSDEKLPDSQVQSQSTTTATTSNDDSKPSQIDSVADTTTSPATQRSRSTVPSAVQPEASSPDRDVSPTEPTEETSSIDSAKIAPSADETTSPEPAKKPTNRITPHRSGRFMDMVHPSADMKGDQAKTAADNLNGVSHKKLNLAPLDPALKRPTVDVVKPPTALADESKQSTESAQKSDWPDPIEQQTTHKEENEALLPSGPEEPLLEAEATPDQPSDIHSESVPTEAAPKSDLDSGNTRELEQETPDLKSSPFLPDTKVEKRPLGGDEIAPTDISNTTEAIAATSRDQTGEFDKHLMEIESGSKSEAAEQSDLPEVSLKNSTSDVDASTPEAEPAKKSPPAPTPVQPKGPISIPQQYQEQPSSNDAASGAIFDTATYHQPLEHPAKKKSGWIWVLLIVVLIVVGAAAGAFAFQQGYL